MGGFKQCLDTSGLADPERRWCPRWRWRQRPKATEKSFCFTLRWIAPETDSDVASGLAHPGKFCERHRGGGHVLDGVEGRHEVEGAVLVRKLFDVPDSELGVWSARRCELHKCWTRIDSRPLHSTGACQRGRKARATPGIQKLLSASWPKGSERPVEQRLHLGLHLVCPDRRHSSPLLTLNFEWSHDFSFGRRPGGRCGQSERGRRREHPGATPDSNSWAPCDTRRVKAKTSRGGVVVSAREAEAFDLVGEQLTHVEIGERLFISVRTVESHVAALRRKLGMIDHRSLVRLAVELRSRFQAGALPHESSSFVGRLAEVENVTTSAATSRVVSVVGPGGTGEDPAGNQSSQRSVG